MNPDIARIQGQTGESKGPHSGPNSALSTQHSALPIPHRPPFLFVDEVVELDENRIVTTALADPQADYFRGHYPGNPIMPGVLICECAFQAGAVLLAHRSRGKEDAKHTPVITRIKDAQFKNIVRPGNRLTVEVLLDDELDNAYYLTGRVTVDGKLAVRVTFTCMLSE